MLWMTLTNAVAVRIVNVVYVIDVNEAVQRDCCRPVPLPEALSSADCIPVRRLLRDDDYTTHI